MSNVLNKSVGSMPTLQIGDRIQFDLIRGRISFWRKNPGDELKWTKLVPFNSTGEYPYEDDILSALSSFATDYSFRWQKITNSNRFTPIFEFV